MKFVALLTAGALVASAAAALAQDNAPAAGAAPQGAAGPSGPPIQLMFVQQASSMKFDGKTMTLEGMAPATTFFSDRPQRIVGHINQDHFVKLWGAEKDGFKADPPNAAVSFVTDNGQPVVIEIEDVKAAGDGALAYTVTVLEGTLPESAGATALFIDPWVAHGGGWHGGWHGGGWGWHGGGWGWGGVAAGAAVGAAAGVAIGAAAAQPTYVYPAPAVKCHYSYYYNQPVCKGVY
jgi:uncharacterized protein YdeI (BOF family)